MLVGTVVVSLGTSVLGAGDPQIQPDLLNQIILQGLVVVLAIVNRFGLSELAQFS